MKKVVIGISGGVDSAVSAAILKNQGFDVIGVFMQNWDPFLNNEATDSKKINIGVCDVEYDFKVASNICKKLEIPLHRVDFIKAYWKNVFTPFLEDYQKGWTPNPDILCNKYIKFGTFFDYCLNQFNCDFIATGHYANVAYNKRKHEYQLLCAKDANKDQTYFLCSLTQSQLAKTLFPIGNYYKSEIREIAKQLNLSNWDRKDSTGICFIGERNFVNFLKNYLPQCEGKIVDVKTNKVVGIHDGVYFYTVGQRKGLNLGGNLQSYFVCAKDIQNNILYVVSNDCKQELLNTNCTQCINFNWINQIPNNCEVQIKFRHSPKKYDGTFTIENGKVILHHSLASAVTLGQYAVIYKDQVCLGGGQIINTYYKK
ncbi:MAG: tRNA 2-thiouridine(34) synthase MnmA [Malacoplasma sp.]|nr:tRNA 2-thiouridine(34) synthase MnmA [Malacoplasma sp.]